MEKYNVYLKKFKVAIGILVAGVALFCFMIAKSIPGIQKISNLQSDYKSQSIALADAERKLENLEKANEAKKVEDEKVLKAFFKPINESSDTETAVSDEFSEILQLIRENKIKARSIKYDYDPQDDNFVKNAGNRYHVCRVSAEMIANYSDFENFLRDLYKHEHFLEIAKIEILPYEKNRRILLISLQLKLYAQKDPSLVQTPTDNPDENKESIGQNVPNLGDNISPELQ